MPAFVFQSTGTLLEEMMAYPMLQKLLPVTAALLPENFPPTAIEDLPEAIDSCPGLIKKMPYLKELAEVEIESYRIGQLPIFQPEHIETWQIPPGLALLEVSWSGLVELLSGSSGVEPKLEKNLILIIPQSGEGPPQLVKPDEGSLLALKLVAEQHDLLQFSKEHGVSVAYLQNILAVGASRGVLLKPWSKIVRPNGFCSDQNSYKKFLRADVFTLQWHITQTCDLHCRHCYDRSRREEVRLEQGKKILDYLYEFCMGRGVAGQVSFTGGNPLLHPDFFELYREAAERGFMTAILGNPTSQANLQKILDIQKPEFFQVSLEGLRQHNDYIRGKGHYDRILCFLKLLKEMDIYSMVMLTLTRANQEEVLSLAEILRDKVDLFTFNRLTMVGEGAALASVAQESYRVFLESYRKAARNNPIMRRKDNLFNILQFQGKQGPEGGCAGHGCGAAFNFVSLLPDGQVHACRKFPSLLGNITRQDLTTIYDNDTARRYRMGCRSCHGCEIHPVCGGCPAVVHGFGKDALIELDPYCFLKKSS